MLTRLYDRVILAYPKTVLVFLALLLAFLGFQARQLVVDASAETLLLEDDRDLRLAREVNERYGAQDFLVVTYSPESDLLSDKSLATLKRLRDELAALPSVDSVTSMLDVPLLESPPVPIKELVSNVRTLESSNVDKALAREELANSPIYRNLLVGPDFKITALLVNLPEDEVYRKLLKERDRLRAKKKSEGLTAEESTEYQRVLSEFNRHRESARTVQHERIVEIREILDGYRGEATLFLGGVSMIADDLITFVKSDLKVFGLGVLAFIVLTLWALFRQLRWVLIPLVCVAASVLAMMGLLGGFGWEVTVISSNFVSLQLIITMSIAIHLVVRYIELERELPDADQKRLILDTVRFMAKPCLFASLTTIAGFGSLILSNILPVITFGWMMSAGITISLLMTFLVFPTLLMLLDRRPPVEPSEAQFHITRPFARFTERRGGLIFGASAAVLLIGGFGVSRLVVENSFIDYFKKSSEIYQGMKLIDDKLGGTTPLDVVLNLEETEAIEPASAGPGVADEFDEFEAEFEASRGEAQYWFTTDKMETIKRIHAYLDELPETGKVLSLATMLAVGEKLNGGEPLDNFKLALIHTELPERFRNFALTPYVSVENNQVRFVVRIRDSEPSLNRNEFLKRVRADLTGKLGLDPEEVHLTGLVVLYNNMLQSLFRSQILTLGAVVAVLMLMFLILFRSVKLAVIAIIPNILSIGVVLGFMGWMGIPLDMMTITIAAISVGIAVDDTIHYIHRFRREFAKDRNYLRAMHECHATIGYAMVDTSIIIIVGFSILVLSNFIPTIYFGVLTGLAMLIALLAALTLLPKLILAVKPLGPEESA